MLTLKNQNREKSWTCFWTLSPSDGFQGFVGTKSCTYKVTNNFHSLNINHRSKCYHGSNWEKKKKWKQSVCHFFVYLIVWLFDFIFLWLVGFTNHLISPCLPPALYNICLIFNWVLSQEHEIPFPWRSFFPDFIFFMWIILLKTWYIHESNVKTPFRIEISLKHISTPFSWLHLSLKRIINPK